jgi:hypothetical protein
VSHAGAIASEGSAELSEELVGFALLLLVAVGMGWQIKRLWEAESLVTYMIGIFIGCLIGIVVGRG